LLEVAGGGGLELEPELEGVEAGAALGAGDAAGVLEVAELESFDLDSPALFASVVLGAVAGAPEADSEGDAAGFLPPSRKSVTYQPDPFN
jgi:hypothetical protein